MTVTINNAPGISTPKELLDRWVKIPVAVAIDLSPEIRQINISLRPLKSPGAQPRLFGHAVTARCEPPDFGAVLHGVDLTNEGEVLIIAAGGISSHAMIGDVLSTHLRDKGVAGVICDGAIRDVATLSEWTDFPIYYRSINPRGPVGACQGAVNESVNLDQCVIHPGDLIIGDDDGLVALSADNLEKWIDSAEARLEVEETWHSRLSNGETMRSLFNL